MAHAMAHAGPAGGLISMTILLPLLWVGLGGLFIMAAFRDRGDGRRPNGSRPKLERLPTVSDHPLRQVRVSLAASKAASRAKAREHAAGGAPAGGGKGPGRRSGARPGRPAPSHIRRVV